MRNVGKQALRASKATGGSWRAISLAFCTLWSNMLLYATSLLARPDNVIFDFRALSMLTSVVGFALAFLVARSGTPLGMRRGLLGCCAVAASAATGLYLLGGSAVPLAANAAADVAYSVTFAFLLVGCCETYARMEPFQALAWAGGSYLVGWLGCAAVDNLPHAACAVVTTLMPLAVLATMPCWGKGTASEPHVSEPTGGASLADDARRVVAALPPRILVGLGVTHLALGAVLAATSVATSAASFLSAPCVAAALGMSLACVVAALALKRRVPLVTFYKVALVAQAVGIFLLTEAAPQAQAITVAASVGVYVVSWAIVAQCAHAGLAIGALPAMVCAAGRLVEQAGEGLGLLAVRSGALSGVLLAGTIAILLLVAAAFLFTGTVDDGEASARFASGRGAGTRASAGAGDSGASTRPATAGNGGAPEGHGIEERVAEVARAYRLSARETDVFALWATGHDLKYVQEKLGLSQSTVKTHVRHIYAKTDTHSRAEVVILLDEAGR